MRDAKVTLLSLNTSGEKVPDPTLGPVSVSFHRVWGWPIARLPFKINGVVSATNPSLKKKQGIEKHETQDPITCVQRAKQNISLGSSYGRQQDLSLETQHCLANKQVGS